MDYTQVTSANDGIEALALVCGRQFADRNRDDIPRDIRNVLQYKERICILIREHEQITFSPCKMCSEEMCAHEFHIVLIDNQMPRMNGIECAKRIRQYEKLVGIDEVSAFSCADVCVPLCVRVRVCECECPRLHFGFLILHLSLPISRLISSSPLHRVFRSLP